MFVFKSLLVAAAIASTNALTSTLQQITANFGTNPTNVQMYLYQPAALASPPPLIIAMHYCGGTAQAYFTGTALAQLADQHGFLVIYPQAPASGSCWDVNTSATLTHNGGSDSLAIANVVRYFIANHGVDATRVFATGTSSGAMMTNVLMGAYPDIFAAGSLYSGVPYGCFAGPNAWNSQCSTGELIMAPQQWGDLVRSGYPGYTGARPKVQFWHGTMYVFPVYLLYGGTDFKINIHRDTTLYPQNFWEEIKQWTNVFGVSQTPVTNTTNDPQAGYSRASFGPNVQGILAQGVGHTVPEHETDTLNWFGLSALVPGGAAPAPTTTAVPTTTIITPTPITPTPIPTTTAPATGATAAHWGQCGGIGWTGPTGKSIFLRLLHASIFIDIILDSVRLALHMSSIKRIRELQIFFACKIYPDISLSTVQPVPIGDIWRVMFNLLLRIPI